MAKYGIFESTNLVATKFGAHIVDALVTEDTENGSVGYVKYVDGVPTFTKFTADTIGKFEPVIVAQPAWSYDESYTKNQRANQFIVEANTTARCYTTVAMDKFSLSAEAIKGTPAVGKYLVLEADSGKFAVSDTAAGAYVAEIVATHMRGASLELKNGSVYGESTVMYEAVVRANVVSYAA